MRFFFELGVRHLSNSRIRTTSRVAEKKHPRMDNRVSLYADAADDNDDARTTSTATTARGRRRQGRALAGPHDEIRKDAADRDADGADREGGSPDRRRRRRHVGPGRRHPGD